MISIAKINRFTSRLVYLITISILGSGCGIEKPQSPSWDSEWELPVLNRRITIAEIINRFDTSNVVYDEMANPRIEIIQPIDTVLVDEELMIESAFLTITDSIGLIEIDPPSDILVTTLLAEIIDINMGFVPPVSFEYFEAIPRFENFTWVDIENGSMQLTVENLFEVDLDTLVVTLIDSIDFHEVAVYNFVNGVSYLESETQTADLAGQTLSNCMFFRYRGHTPGGVLIYAGEQSLEATLVFPDGITVSAAMAEVPEIVKVKSGRYEIDDSTKIYSSVMASGTINFNILNDSELPFTVQVHSPNFQLDGSELTLSQEIPPNNSMQLLLDLAGHNFIPDDESPLQAVTVDLVSTVAPSAPVQYTFRSDDTLRVDVDVSDIRFSEIDGRLEPTIVGINPITRNLDLPDGLDHARLAQGTLSVEVSNNSMLPAYLNLLISGGGREVPLNGYISPKTGPSEPPAQTIITATREQTTYFFDPPPDAMVISGTGTINPDYVQSTIRLGDSFVGDVVFNSIFAIVIPDTITIEPRVASIRFDDGRPDDFRDRVGYGVITATLQNHLPLGTNVTLFIGTADDSTIFADPTSLILGPYSITAGLLDDSGRVISPATSVVSDSIDNYEMAVFDSDSLFIGESIDLLPTDTTGVLIMGTDYLDIRAIARLQIRFGGE